MTGPRKPGRPPLPDGEAKAVVISARVTRRTAADLDREAIERGISRAELLEKILRERQQ